MEIPVCNSETGGECKGFWEKNGWGLEGDRLFWVWLQTESPKYGFLQKTEKAEQGRKSEKEREREGGKERKGEWSADCKGGSWGPVPPALQ